MKSAVVLTTLLAFAVANPVAIANVDNTNAIAKRNVELEARQLGGIDLSSLPGLSILQGLGLPGLSNLPINSGNVVSVLTNLLASVLSVVGNILPKGQGVPGIGAIPNLPAIPTIPGVSVPAVGAGTISAEQLTALIGALQAQVANATSIGTNLPAGLSLAQLQQIQTIIATIQAQIAPLISGTGLPSLPGVPTGGLPDLGGLTSGLGALSGVLSLVTGLLGPLLGGLLGGLGGGLLGGRA
ncbi:hypothetical protein JMJ77_0013077 [Colletotrichum scovillei]|uniref:Uncharacterized protein n=1 Tax=Colletotrichum scovillei TaxID=1209932 RepID=A0A9P7R6B2_9PEZI|nr:hypothetical protein JMJ77_0013077 [Colletotrichum scovillei]KAG7069365.1 hypothetical protein JMJ76_0003038 [Colletotrichum scovillei]KAG7073315.1 hypothetical protein JMJ78_0014294 [Colletotrichum scovillei]